MYKCLFCNTEIITKTIVAQCSCKKLIAPAKTIEFITTSGYYDNECIHIKNIKITKFTLNTNYNNFNISYFKYILNDNILHTTVVKDTYLYSDFKTLNELKKFFEKEIKIKNLL